MSQVAVIGYQNEEDRLSSLRGTRFHAGQCLSCGDPAPTEHLHPTMTEYPTHCRDCAVVELKMREKAHKMGKAGLFFYMLVRE